jgi:FkbM family methyltransferase
MGPGLPEFNKMKKLIKKAYHLFKKPFSTDLKDPCHFIEAYSQQGEDLVVNCILQSNTTGFYVDVGAHHPLRYSNTYLFYQKGWRGINIDPRPGIMAEFARVRPRDINLELGVSNHAGNLTYYIFSDPALNTFDEESAKRCEANGRFKLIKQCAIPTRPLSDILDEYMPSGTTIDLLSIDVEGFDEEVLRSNNWVKYRPRLILAEDVEAFTFEQVIHSKQTKYLKDIGYIPVSKLVHTTVYCDAVKAKGTADALVA